MIFWTFLIVSLNMQPSIATIHCNDEFSIRPPTDEEIENCLREGYRSFNNDHDPCTLPKYDYNGITMCTAWQLESNDILHISEQKPKCVIFKNSFINAIPSRLFEKYSSLQKIYVNHSNIAEIDLNAFNGLANLEELYLQNNFITEIGKGTLNSLINLLTLDISNNNISIVEKKSFHGLTDLHALNISHNQIQDISDDMFDPDLHSLRALNLSHNFISTIELTKILKLFSPFEENVQIDFSYNRIKSFNFLQLTLNLDTLNLNNNNLDTLGDLNNLIAIKYLDLSNNRLSKFNIAPENVRYLNLSGNSLQNYNISFRSSSQIEILDVGRNFIKNFDANTFDNLRKLTNLCLKENLLVSLPMGLFKNLKKLEILSLSGNHLKQFEFGIFSGLSNLLELDISNNSISNLDYRTFHTFTHLKVLNIANNELTTIDPYDIINYCKDLELVILNDNPWYCQSLLNFTRILYDNNNKTRVLEGSHTNVTNHHNHGCHDDKVTEKSDKKIFNIDGNSIKNEVNDLKKFFEFDFRNSSFYHFFANYNGLNDYFNKDFKNTAFYKSLDKNISLNYLSSEYDKNIHNLTKTLNLLNLKLSNLNQPNLIGGLPNSSQINFEKFGQVLSNFSNFDSKFTSSNFYKFFNKNFTNLNSLNKSTVDLLNGNLEKFSKSVDDITSFVEKESSLYKLLQSKIENGSFGQISPNRFPQKFPEALASNISYAKLTGASDRNEDVAHQVASLRGSFIAFMTILITVLLIAIFLPVLKKFASPCTKYSNANLGTSESTADIPMVQSSHDSL